jgi:CheY-like chemotaxis protein/anti-sigma regulatory factor (Ser/Thr protein kinase)
LEATGRAHERRLAMQREFFSVASHEIRTPLHGILGLAHLVAESGLSEAQRRDVDAIRQCGQGLLALLDDLLDYTKVDGGFLELESIPVDLAAELDAVATLYKPLAAAKQLQLRTDLELGDRWFIADPVRLRQVVSNLTLNALKFTEVGEVVVEARLTAGVAGLAGVRIAVRDTGPGIPPERRERLFRPFSQLDASVARSHGGTGLGLSIAARLVAAMRSAIYLESAVGAGTTFYFTVDLATTAPVASPVTCPGPRPSGMLTPPSVLVADDDAISRRILLAVLRRLGIEATAVADGVDAVAAVQAGSFDVVLMDMHMPRMDGIAATHAIRALGVRQPHVLALTASTFDDDRASCLAAGMDGFLSKPCSMDGLRGALTRFWRMSEEGR